MAATVEPLRPATMTRADAEALAIEVLAFIGSDDERAGRFLAVSGLTPETLRPVAGSRLFLLGVLDYLVADEWLMRAYCHRSATHPQAVHAARTALAPAVEQPLEPSRSIVIRCDHCGTTTIRRRSELPHAPPAATRLSLPRCARCGGGFDQVETWLDRRGHEVG